MGHIAQQMMKARDGERKEKKLRRSEIVVKKLKKGTNMWKRELLGNR